MVRGFFTLGILTFALSGALFGLDTSASGSAKWQVSLEQREHQVWVSVSRDAAFSDVPHAGVATQCDSLQPPEPVTTPDPFNLVVHEAGRVTISFIVGTDGRVLSPLILQSGGPVPDRSVLRAVRIWRFRPATCNGVPTEIEGKIEFSGR